MSQRPLRGGVAQREHIAAVLALHAHVYDSDCGVDYGCMCGARLAAEPFGRPDRDAFAAHLSEALRGPTPTKEASS